MYIVLLVAFIYTINLLLLLLSIYLFVYLLLLLLLLLSVLIYKLCVLLARFYNVG